MLSLYEGSCEARWVAGFRSLLYFQIEIASVGISKINLQVVPGIPHVSYNSFLVTISCLFIDQQIYIVICTVMHQLMLHQKLKSI